MAADKKPTKPNKKPLSAQTFSKKVSADKTTKKTQTVRQRSETSQNKQPRRLKQTAANVVTPLKKAGKAGRKEFHLPLPDNKAGRFLGKRGRLTPKFVREAWQEIKQVSWPNRKETMRLTLAVFVFALIFAIIVGLLDFGLDKLFKNVILDLNK